MMVPERVSVSIYYSVELSKSRVCIRDLSMNKCLRRARGGVGRMEEGRGGREGETRWGRPMERKGKKKKKRFLNVRPL